MYAPRLKTFTNLEIMAFSSSFTTLFLLKVFIKIQQGDYVKVHVTLMSRVLVYDQV